jgi:hypothetical protein
VSREAWSAQHPQSAESERAMTAEKALPGHPSELSDQGKPAPQPGSGAQAPPSWPWRRGALILAGAAQLITISALTSADPLTVSWSALLLAIAPAPLAAAAAFAPARLARAAAVVCMVVLVAGIVGGISHTGLFFVPALVVLAIGTVRLWQEQP